MITKDTNTTTNIPEVTEDVGAESTTVITPPEQPADNVSAKLDEFAKTLADYKKQIGDRDRKVSELYTTIESLNRDKMTDEEKFENDKKEFDEQRVLFEKQQVEFEAEKMRNYVADKLTALGLTSGLSVSEIVNLKDMVLAGTIEETDKKIESLVGTLGKITQFKFEGAGKPATSKSPANVVWNPWMPDQLSVTEQHKLWKDNPEKAEQLKKAALRSK